VEEELEAWEVACAPESRLRSAVEVELKPRILVSRRRREKAEKPLARAVTHPSLFQNLVRLAFALAEKGYRGRVTFVRVEDLTPAKLLPPFLLKPLARKGARVVLEVYRR